MLSYLKPRIWIAAQHLPKTVFSINAIFDRDVDSVNRRKNALNSWIDSLDFQKKLRAHWQLHQHVTYCLYGSKRHMLMEVFSSPSMPFYKFGDIIFLEKIKENDWIEFITKRFNDTGKSIDIENAANIAKHCENHPYYVQQLACRLQDTLPRTCRSEHKTP